MTDTTDNLRERPRYSNSPWTSEKIKRLCSLLAGAPMSAAELAAALNVPRAAIIGKVRRLGLKMPRDKKQAAVAMRKPESRRSQCYQGTNPRPTDAPVEFLGITMLDLQDGQCKFPRGETAPFLFCGQPQCDNSSYCARCYRITHNTHYSRFETQEERAIRIRVHQRERRTA